MVKIRKSPSIKLNEIQLKDLKDLQIQATQSRDAYFSQYSNLNYRIISEEMQGIEPGVERTVGRDRIRRVNPEFTKSEFKSQEDLIKYMNKLEQVASPEYYSKKNEQLKSNIVSALYNTYGSYASELVEYINQADTEEITRIFYTTDALNFDFIYQGMGVEDDEYIYERINYIWHALGFNQSILYTEADYE